MSVRVTAAQFGRDYQPIVFDHPSAASYQARTGDEFTNGAALVLFDAKGERIATYAPGCWASAEKVPTPGEPEALRITVRIPDWLRGKRWDDLDDFDQQALRDNVVQALEVGFAHAPLRDQAVEPEPVVNAAARDNYPEAAKCPSVTLAAETTTTAEATLSETSEPYVSVSVSANDADELAKLVRKLIREKGAKSFGLAAG